MILKIFAVRDHKTAQYANPMFLITDGHAIRSFNDAVNNQEDKNNPLNKHPEDFELFRLGEFDTDTGIITATPPSSVVSAAQLKQQ